MTEIANNLLPFTSSSIGHVMRSSAINHTTVARSERNNYAPYRTEAGEFPQLHYNSKTTECLTYVEDRLTVICHRTIEDDQTVFIDREVAGTSTIELEAVHDCL